ncbi:MAG: hypothetical protein NTV54_12365 [Ignavibacteriales bacterium]|nr:hypothetical protein [Ignavibacteriales bacterium]
MKSTMFVVVVAIAAFSFAGCASGQYTQKHGTRVVRIDTLRAMTTQDVLALSKAGVSDSLVVSMLDASDSWFQLKPREVVELKNAGISEKVIAAMLSTREEQSQSTESGSVSYYTYWDGGFYPFWGSWGYRPFRSVYVYPSRVVHRSHGFWMPRGGGHRRR